MIKVNKEDQEDLDILTMIRNKQKQNQVETSPEKLKHFLDSLNETITWEDTTRAYVAAFIDADGSVSLASKGGKDKFRTPCVEFYNNDYMLMKRIAKFCNCVEQVKKRKSTNPNHADSYEVRVTGDKALKIMIEIYEFMLHTKKKQRVELITKYYKMCTPRNGKYTEDELEMKKWLEESVMSIQMRGKEVDNLA